jgi:hypothetical protein
MDGLTFWWSKLVHFPDKSNVENEEDNEAQDLNSGSDRDNVNLEPKVKKLEVDFAVAVSSSDVVEKGDPFYLILFIKIHPHLLMTREMSGMRKT